MGRVAEGSMSFMGTKTPWSHSSNLVRRFARAMVGIRTSFGILLTLYACLFQCLFHLIGHFRATRSFVLDLVRLRREPIVVVEQLVPRAARDGDLVGRPVCRHKNDGFRGFRSAQLEDFRDLGLQGLCNSSMPWISKQRHRASAMRERDDRGETRHVSRVGRDWELLYAL
jgi:hypothetical protein